jgi:hypothetical protein
MDRREAPGRKRMGIRSPVGAARHPIYSPPASFLLCRLLFPPTTFVRFASAPSLRFSGLLDWGRAKLSCRYRKKTVPEVFVFKSNILIFEAKMIAIPSPSLKEMKYFPISKDLSTLCSYAQLFLDPPPGNVLALAMRGLLSPFFCHQQCRYSPDFGPFFRKLYEPS